MLYFSIALFFFSKECIRHKVQLSLLGYRHTDFDLIVACNLIDRLWDPRAFLDETHRRLRAGGLLVLVDPYTWLAEYTPKGMVWYGMVWYGVVW